jgi:hypothetical protein
VNRHRTHIVRHEDATLARSETQYFRIVGPLQFCFSGGEEIDTRFAEAGAGDNREIQVGIRNESDAHDLILLIKAGEGHQAASPGGLAQVSPKVPGSPRSGGWRKPRTHAACHQDSDQ